MKLKTLWMAATLTITSCLGGGAQSADWTNPTEAVSPEGVYLPPNVSVLKDGFAGVSALAADPRVAQWVALQQAGQYRGLVTAAEADLRSAAPHPYATHIWSWAQWKLGQLTADSLPAVPLDLSEGLTLAARAFVYELAQRDDLLTGLAEETLANDAPDYWADYEIAYAACSVEFFALCQRLGRRLVTHFPRDFGAAYLVASYVYRDPVGSREWLDASPALRDTPAGQLIVWMLARPDETVDERARLSQFWLDHAPEDPNALRRLGYAYEDLFERDKALEQFEREHAVYPFRDAPYRIARAHAGMRQFDEAFRVTRDWAAQAMPRKAEFGAGARMLIDALSHAGEYGRLREVAIKALETEPNDARLRISFATALRKEGFPNEAVVTLAPVIAQEPSHYEAMNQFVRALDGADRHRDVIDAALRYRDAGGFPNDGVLNYLHEALIALDRRDEAEGLHARFLEELPEAVWLQGNGAWALNKYGQTEEALERIRAIVMRHPGSNWRNARLGDYARAALGNDGAQELIRAFLSAYPYKKAGWEQLIKSGLPALETWEEAIRKAPLESFPVEELAQVLEKANPSDWQGIQDRLQSEIERMQAMGAPDGEVAQVYFERAVQLDNALVHGHLNDAQYVEQGLQDLEKARALGLRLSQYWNTRYFLLSRRGASPERTTAALRRIETHPDDKDAYMHLFASETARALGSSAMQFSLLQRYLDRRPRSSERLKSVAHRHNKWGGSAVVALSLLDRARRWDPDADLETETENAYSDLGAHKRFYEARYNRATKISNSLRYVNWFDSYRKATDQDQMVVKSLDFDRMSVVQIRPDGIEWERHFHATTGRLQWFRLGAVTGKFGYTEEGFLTSVSIATHPGIEIQYGPITPDGLTRNVSVMTIDDHGDFRFEYNDLNKPVEIEMVGVGKLSITYDEAGETTDVSADMMDGSEDSFALSNRIVTAFDRLQRQTRIVSDVQKGDFSGLSTEDSDLDEARHRIDRLWERADTSFGDQVQAELNLAALLIDKVADHPDHMVEAEELLSYAFGGLSEAYSDDPDYRPGWLAHTPNVDQLTIETVRLWRALMVETRPSGMTRGNWALWSEMRAVVSQIVPDDPETIGQLARLRAEIAQGGLRVLSDAGWLKRSHLTNPGYWRNFRQSEVFPKALSTQDLRMRDVLVRANGDVVVVSDKGFAVLRRGFWEWFGYDAGQGRFSASADLSGLNGTSNIAAIAEDGQGRLWLGTRAGLFMLGADYDQTAQLWRAGEAGFLAGSVEALAMNGGQLAIGGNAGLALMDLEAMNVEIIDERAVEGLRAARDGWLVMGRDALMLQEAENRAELTDFRVVDAVLDPDTERLFALKGNQLLAGDLEDLIEGSATWSLVEGQESIQAVDMPFGLARASVLEDETGLLVLTDQGGAVMGEGAFEMFSRPDAVRPVALRRAHERDGRLFMITSEGVSGVVRGEARRAGYGRVHDLLTDAELGVTFVATGNSIDVVDHQDAELFAGYFSDADATRLELAPDGALITHDGLTVLKFERGSLSPQELFHAEQIGPDGPRYADLQDILAASDGSVWALAGASVFHWREGQELREFSMFAGDPTYPVRSDMLFAIHEDPEGRILLVASNEGHRNYNNRNMYGGLFAFDGSHFVKASADVLGSWFLSSMTRIDETTAIAGTASGFARVRGDKIDGFDQIEDASYLALKEVQPALYLGTEGVKLGKDLWLFGSAGGVVAYKSGTWFYADRLNWILPRSDLANYGARTIHALETDAEGRVYVGTDWGLTIYDPDGAGPESFLISEQRSDFAFSAMERDRMQAVNDILMEALPDDSPAGKAAKAFRKSRKQIVALEEKLSAARVNNSADAGQIERKLLKARQRDIAILAKLERDQPALFNMLQLNPLDLRALGQRLPDGVLVAQYLPTPDALFINLVSNDGAALKSVRISQEMLNRNIRIAARNMAAQARGQLRGFGTKVGKKPDAKGGEAKPDQRAAEALQDGVQDQLEANLTSGEDATTASLRWLYEALLRPIEHDVPDGATLVISPSGPLAYLPFGALIREVTESGPEYAVQRFDMTTAPSLYAVDMMIDAVPSTAFSHLVFGDPDGSLPHARQEAEKVADILSEDLVELRVGEEATYDELLDYGGDARFVHLAMHGKLDHTSPKDSYLLLADNRRMSIPQIMTLPLSEAELVFLSACESGLGTDGLEFRTMAHAFAHAGAPAVVATLWQVDDAATRKLAQGFYSAKMEGEGNAAALRRAQREIIKAGGKHARPGYWAGVTLFGKP